MFLPHPSAVIPGNVNLSFKGNLFWIMAKERIIKVLVLQQQKYQEELQIIASTFIVQYAYLAQFLDSCFGNGVDSFLLKLILQGLVVNLTPLEVAEALLEWEHGPKLSK